jgi:hypothetical protein
MSTSSMFQAALSGNRAICIGLWILGLSLGASAASEFPADDLSNRFYILNYNPPSISIIGADDYRQVGSIPVDPKPMLALIGPGNRFIYVLHNGLLGIPGRRPKEPNILSIYDAKSREVVKRISLGWYVSRIEFSQDKRYLFCLALGKLSKKQKSPAEMGALIMIDTRSNEIVMQVPQWRMAWEAVWSPDASRIFVLGVRDFKNERYSALTLMREANAQKLEVMSAGLKITGMVLTIFKNQSMESPVETPLTSTTAGLMLSTDGKWLYILDPGPPSKDDSKPGNGTMRVIDADSGTSVASHKVGSKIRWLRDPGMEGIQIVSQGGSDSAGSTIYRIVGDKLIGTLRSDTETLALYHEKKPAGLWAIDSHLIQFFNEDGETPAKEFMMRVTSDTEPKKKNRYLAGKPLAVLPLPDSRKLALLTDENMLGIADFNKERLSHIVDIGRKGVRIASGIGNFFAGIGYGLMAGGGFGLIPQVMMAASVDRAALSRPVLRALESRPDEAFVYVLNSPSKDVTIVNSADGSAVDYIPVGSDCFGFIRFGEGEWIGALARTRFTLIDTAANRESFQYEFSLKAGALRNYAMTAGNRSLLLLFEKTLQVWDPQKPNPVAAVEGLNEAIQFIFPESASTPQKRD